jgi:hypothetical protein
MKRHEACDEATIRDLLDYLNNCHDGSMRRICFLKRREYSEKGDLVYPYSNLEDLVKCDIEIELLLNSYAGALSKQVVVLYFEEVRAFRFFQEKKYDYSEIYKLTFRRSDENEFEFVFRIGPEARLIDVLCIICTKIICTETDEDYYRPA